MEQIHLFISLIDAKVNEITTILRPLTEKDKWLGEGYTAIFELEIRDGVEVIIHLKDEIDCLEASGCA